MPASSATSTTQASPSCGLSQEVALHTSQANYTSILAAEQALATGGLDTFLEAAVAGCLSGIAVAALTDTELVLEPLCLGGANLFVGALGSVDDLLDAINTAIFWSQVILECQPIFLQAISASSPTMELSSAAPTQPLTIHGTFASLNSFTVVSQVVNQAANDATKDLVGSFLDPDTCGTCESLIQACGDCDNLFDWFSGQLSNLVAGYISDILSIFQPPSLPSPPPQTIILGVASISTDLTQAPALNVTLPCQDGDNGSVTLVESTTATLEAVTFRADKGYVSLSSPSLVPSAEVSVQVQTIVGPTAHFTTAAQGESANDGTTLRASAKITDLVESDLNHLRLLERPLLPRM